MNAETWEEGECQRACKGTQPHRRQEKAESMRADVQHLVCEQRHQGGPVHGEERENRDRDEQHSDDRLASRVRQALGEPNQEGLLLLPRDLPGQVSHRQQGRDRCDVAN
jgi:hypothetical protein